jgi:hypothetical protein
MGEKRTAYKVLGNRHLEDLFSIIFIERIQKELCVAHTWNFRCVITLLCIGLMHHVLQPNSLMNTVTAGHRIKKKNPQEPGSFTNFVSVPLERITTSQIH